MSSAGAVQQPYIPTDAEQAEHLQNLIRKLKEFWVEQLAEMETLSLATEQVRVGGWAGWGSEGGSGTRDETVKRS